MLLIFKLPAFGSGMYLDFFHKENATHLFFDNYFWDAKWEGKKPYTVIWCFLESLRIEANAGGRNLKLLGAGEHLGKDPIVL